MGFHRFTRLIQLGLIQLGSLRSGSLRLGAIFLALWFGLSAVPSAFTPPAYARGADGIAQLKQTAEQPGNAIQPYLDRVAESVTEFTLDNGMKFIVLEQHEAPVVSMMLYANVGAANEEDGQTGVAHYLEHLAFKGTTRIGTRDYPAEKKALDALDVVFDDLMAAESAGDEAKQAELSAKFAEIQDEAASYVEQNKFGQIIEQTGGTGLNATTSAPGHWLSRRLAQSHPR